MWSRTKARILDLWRTLRLPSRHYSLGFLTVAGFIAGILFCGGFNTALEATNTLDLAERAEMIAAIDAELSNG